jgi:hypothetical protein
VYTPLGEIAVGERGDARGDFAFQGKGVKVEGTAVHPE